MLSCDVLLWKKLRSVHHAGSIPHKVTLASGGNFQGRHGADVL